MLRARSDRTYRVRQLPVKLQLNDVARFLAAASLELGPPSNIRVFSVAPALKLYEKVPTKVATVVFRQTPKCFDNDKGQWIIISHDPEWPQAFLFDVHFTGFTPLNDVALSESYLDCIAISGLASHAFGSWKQRGNSDFMWLRDQLPLDVPYARSIIYGYDTHIWDSESFQGIDDLALSLLAHFRSISAPNTAPRSLVIFAHSLGGIVLKRAIAAAANSGQEESAVLSNIRIIFFFGVPNQGMYMSHLLALTGSQPNQQLIRELSRDSEYLSKIDIQFSGLAVFREVRFVSIYETKRSRTTKEIRPGVWKREGPYEVLVTRSSAIQRGTRPLDIIPVDEDHSEIAKFSEQDPTYELVHSRLRELKAISSNGPTRIMDTAGPWSGYGKISPGGQDKLFYRNEMLKSLYLEETVSRRKQIESTYSITFEWIFKDRELQFGDWLRNGRGIYWIRGKPGSGKSTLMKFLYMDQRTRKCLDSQSRTSAVSSGWFFFYGRGSRIQKSFEGLLYSILHQILSAQGRLADIVLPFYMDYSEILEKHWSFSDLKAAFDLILKQKDFPLQIYLFLDALDEYEGQPEMVVDFLKSLTKPTSNIGTQVNICFSSRPSNAFVEAFDNSPGFSIHERTREDIWTFTEGKMRDSRSMKQLLQSPRVFEKEAVEDLILMIVQRAHGVFLWVRLVVTEVLRACTDGANIRELTNIVSETPIELKDYYRNIIQHLPKRHRLESYVMFEILLRFTRSPLISEFTAAVDCALCATLQDSIIEMRRGPLSDMTLGALLRRLQSRCGGLVEVTGDDMRAVVSFMHQTVKELVGEPGFEQRMLGQQAQPLLQNGHGFLFKYYVSMGEMTIRSSFLHNYLELCTLHGTSSELTTGMSQKQFLDSIGDDTVRAWNLCYKSCRVRNAMSFAVWNDLRLYVRDRAALVRQHKNSLLHVVVHRYLLVCVGSTITIEGPRSSFSPMCRLLLSLGAELDVRLDGKTPFQILVGSLFGFRVSGGEEDFRFGWQLSDYSMKDGLGLVASLLDYGQSPDVELLDVVPTELFQSCKALHISEYKMAKLLLDHGAAVNALTSGGHTALDLSIESTIIHSTPRDPAEAFATTKLLLDHGGCITRFGEACLDPFLKSLEYHSAQGHLASTDELAERLRRAPILRGIRPTQGPPVIRLGFGRMSIFEVSSWKEGEPEQTSSLDNINSASALR